MYFPRAALYNVPMTTTPAFKPQDRVQLTLKVNARSTDPITQAQHLPDSFRLLKRGLQGTVEAVDGDFLVVTFDNVQPR